MIRALLAGPVLTAVIVGIFWPSDTSCAVKVYDGPVYTYQLAGHVITERQAELIGVCR